MNNIKYSALIRTFNSEKTLLSTLDSLANQSLQPNEYIFVDSGSVDGTFNLLPQGSIIHKFIGSEFNYSEALNQGIKHVSTDYVMIISSHTLLQNCNAIEYALNVLSLNETIGAAYFCLENTGELKYVLIDKNNFNGFNGLWNTCSIIKMDLLKRRSFRREVFAAEDQEWARWLFFCEEKAVARFSGSGMDNSGNRNLAKHSLKKRLNEYVAIAYFVNRDLLGWFNLARIAFRVIKPVLSLSLIDRFFNLSLFFRLFSCHFFKPKYKSRYF
ncbi:MAG: glycosyltransferase family A protein [Syntrophales bacterium]